MALGMRAAFDRVRLRKDAQSSAEVAYSPRVDDEYWKRGFGEGLGQRPFGSQLRRERHLPGWKA